MDFFFGLFDSVFVDWLMGKLGSAVQSRVAENIFVLGIVWWFMRKRVSNTFTDIKTELSALKTQFGTHMASVETGLTNINTGLGQVRLSFESLEKSHSTRLSGLESGVKDLSDRVGKLEKKD